VLIGFVDTGATTGVGPAAGGTVLTRHVIGDARMDVVTLVVGILAPYLPHLLNAGRNIVGGAAAEAEAHSWDLAKSLWSKLRPRVEAKPAAQEAVRDVAAHPDDEEFRAALRVQVRKLLADDPALAAELGRLIQDTQQPASSTTTVTAIGDRSQAAGHDNINVRGDYIGRDSVRRA
jgi:hypothetical protein